ncbi:MAG: cytochrome c oxidase accessory protein CcoG [Phycisphaeraceae bacterium]|nr:cytochrome c oxidase accessory protein CcoG [Phycisphaeraceae bacterium]
MGDISLPMIDGRVLPTMNADGSRRWLTPRPASGRYWKARLVVAWALIALFTILPWLRIHGQPPILLDLVSRRFVFFGGIFRPTDTLLLALLMLSIFTAVFLATAIFGRVWCGWGCPQTVYLEFVFRPIERFFMGKAWGRKGATVPAWRMVAMYAAFVVLSAHLANTFLAYFVGTDQLVGWTLGSPLEHPTAFMVFAATTGLMLFDFCFFREQLCTLACPYGRFQSVLLDRDSLVVGYDRVRGEPRGPIRRAERAMAAVAPASTTVGTAQAVPDRQGDCIDCTMCVQVCPTGIDIRNGLQMECINCTQCIDACDEVMDKVGRDRGLIRYSSQRRLEGEGRGGFRLRLVVYPLLLVTFVVAFVLLLATRRDGAAVQMRTPGVAYALLADGMVASPVRMRIDNRLDATRHFELASLDPAVRIEGDLSATVPGHDSAEVSFRAVAPRASFARGHRTLLVQIRDAEGRSFDAELRLIGPLDEQPLGGRP